MSASVDRKPTNVSLPTHLVAEAKALGVNLSRASEAGVEAAVAVERKRRWAAENQEAFASYNQWIEEHGLPLDAFRRF